MEEERRRARVKQVAQRALILERAALLPENSRACCSSSNLRQLTDVIVDRESKMGLDTKAGVTAVQVWLKSRGYRSRSRGATRMAVSLIEALVAAQKGSRRIFSRKPGLFHPEPALRPGWCQARRQARLVPDDGRSSYARKSS